MGLFQETNYSYRWNDYEVFQIELVPAREKNHHSLWYTQPRVLNFKRDSNCSKFTHIVAREVVAGGGGGGEFPYLPWV